MKTYRSYVLKAIYDANDQGRIFHVEFEKADGTIRQMTCKKTTKFHVETLPPLNPKKKSDDPPVVVHDLDKLKSIEEVLAIVPETDIRCFPQEMRFERSFRPERLISATVDGIRYEVDHTNNVDAEIKAFKEQEVEF